MDMDIDSFVTRLLEQSGETYSGFHGWVSPAGKKYRTSSHEAHTEHAGRLLDKFYPDWEETRQDVPAAIRGVTGPGTVLLYKGWVRVVSDGLYSVYRLDSATRGVLRDIVGELDTEVIPSVKIDVGVGSQQCVNGSPAEVLELLYEPGKGE